MTFIETLKPLTVPVGLVALGTVARIGSNWLKLHITDGVHVAVERMELSTPLRELFKVGQQYICKIIETRKRQRTEAVVFNSVDLIGSLEASSIYENIPISYLRLDHAPIQGIIRSIEDHGFQVDIGFNQILGFLSFNDVPKNVPKFKVGQVIRCCIKQPLAEGKRIVQLSMKPVHMNQSIFDEEKSVQHTIPKSFLIPGAQTFGIVMKVVKSAVILKILNEYNAFYRLKDDEKKEYKISDKVDCYILHYHPLTRTFAVSLHDPATISTIVVTKEKEKSQLQKSRRQRSEEARLREEKLRKAENDLIDPNRRPQCIDDFERTVFAKPDVAKEWISYSRYHLENGDTDTARTICRRALKTINFRLQKEKLKIWGHMFNIESRFGGMDRLREVMNEALAINDKLSIYQSVARALVKNRIFKEADEMFQVMIKRWKQDVDVWCDYIEFVIKEKRDFDTARQLDAKAVTCLSRANVIRLKSKYAQLMFKYGEIERAKTIFDLLITSNPKRRDLLQVYNDMVRKYASD